MSTHSVVFRKLNVCGHVLILLSFSLFWYVELTCELVQEFYAQPVLENGFGGQRRTRTVVGKLIQKFSL